MKSHKIIKLCLILTLLFDTALASPAVDSEHSVVPDLTSFGLRESATAMRDAPGWERPSKIVIAISDQARVKQLRDSLKFSGVDVVMARNPIELAKLIVGADALVGPCLETVINAAPRLRWIQSAAVGVEDCMDIPSIRDGRIVLTNLQKVTASTVAEHAFGLLLALARQIPLYLERQRNNGDRLPLPHMSALEGKTLLVVGLGSVGTEVAKRAKAFGMNVIGIRRHKEAPNALVEYVGNQAELAVLVERSNVIVNCTPLTEETLNMFNSAIFEHMPSDSIFINVGRGGSVVTADLVKALQSGRILAAGLDVVDPDPLPHEHPLRQFKNVIITPHIADESDRKADLLWAIIQENVHRYVTGGRLLAVVDAKQGY